jgi:hypothetical protein
MIVIGAGSGIRPLSNHGIITATSPFFGGEQILAFGGMVHDNKLS